MSPRSLGPNNGPGGDGNTRRDSAGGGKDSEFGLGCTELALPFPPTEAGKCLPPLSSTAACSVGTMTEAIRDLMQDFPVL